MASQRLPQCTRIPFIESIDMSVFVKLAVLEVLEIIVPGLAASVSYRPSNDWCFIGHGRLLT